MVISALSNMSPFRNIRDTFWTKPYEWQSLKNVNKSDGSRNRRTTAYNAEVSIVTTSVSWLRFHIAKSNGRPIIISKLAELFAHRYHIFTPLFYKPFAILALGWLASLRSAVQMHCWMNIHLGRCPSLAFDTAFFCRSSPLRCSLWSQLTTTTSQRSWVGSILFCH